MSIWEKKVRQALCEGAKTTVEIQAHVVASMGFRPLSSYKTLRSVIRSVCERLKADGEIEVRYQSARGEYVWEATAVSRAA